MSLLGRAGALRRVHALLSSSRNRQASLSPVLAEYSHGSTPVSRCLSSLAGGKPVSEAPGNGSEGAKRKTWSAWEVAGASCLAGIASFGMIAYPRSVQNEPSVEAVPPRPGRHSVSFVQRAPNRIQNLVLENEKSAEGVPFREKFHTKNRRSVGDGKPYDVSVMSEVASCVT